MSEKRDKQIKQIARPTTYNTQRHNKCIPREDYRRHNKWNEYTEIECVKMWAYIDDLLPKGGEK